MNKQDIEALCVYFDHHLPDVQCALNYTNAYTLLVAVVLSAQSTDAGVNKATPRLFALADTPEKMVALGVESLQALIKTIGLYRRKAAHIMALSQRLIQDYGGAVPQDRQALESLPGVGRKTANVVLNVFFHHPTIPVDTHVFRVAHRLGLSQGRTPSQVEAALEAQIPERWKQQMHVWLVHHGRTICKARRPLCGHCGLRQWCAFYHQQVNKSSAFSQN